MRHRRRVPGKARLTAGMVLALVAAAPAGAADPGTVDRFVALSDRFQAQLARPQTAGFSAGQKRDRAVCILTRFEGEFGADGVASLMRLMDVLSRSPEFDDPTVVAFNDRYGGVYAATVEDCTQAARRS